MINRLVSNLIQLALEEDISTGDITTNSCVPTETKGIAKLIAKQDMVICGLEVFTEVFKRIDANLIFDYKFSDGDFVKSDSVICTVTGDVSALLVAERTALNFIQKLSGVATKTRKIVELVKEHKVKIVDTRKTTPGWRVLEKYAVKIGGGENHRQGLYDAVLIKNNHIDVNKGDIVRCIKMAKSKNQSGIFIQVEVRDLAELISALTQEVDSILLDNLNAEQTSKFVEIIRKNRPNMIIESSGGINESNIKAYAATGIDRISLGAITHSAIAVDLSLRINAI